MINLKDHWDEEEQGFRCWCSARFHKGEYAQEDWIMHHCEHRHVHFMGVPGQGVFSEENGSLSAICSDCGRTFSIGQDITFS